jgi:hypothetical protein
MKNQNQSKIIVVGYYNHDNIGDEQYKLTLKYLFEKLNIDNYKTIFVDCDKLKSHPIDDMDIIILGGGDILNHYFLDEINNRFFNKPNKIIALSVGLPYNDILIDTNKLNIIDYIFLRTQQDIPLFQKYFKKEQIFYLPDLSYFLLKILPCHNNSAIKLREKLGNIKKSGKKIIAFCLNRHIYSKTNKGSYRQIAYEFSKTIDSLIQQGFYIVLLPFNTSNDILDMDENMENDIFFQNNVFMGSNYSHQILNINIRLTVTETFGLFDFFHITVPMRFHACLFSIYKNVPMVPVFTTKKIKNFLIDIKWETYYKLETNDKDLPIQMDADFLLSQIKSLIDEPKSILSIFFNLFTIKKNIANKYKNKKVLLIDACTKIESDIDKKNELISNLLKKPYDKKYIMKENHQEIIIDTLIEKIEKYKALNIDKNLIVSIVSYFLVNRFDSKYNDGLLSKMFDPEKNFDYKEEWKWILNDQEPTMISYDSGIFNMNFINQIDESNCHRSGWGFITKSLQKFNNEKAELYMDFSIDKTFHWNEEKNKLVGILPYKQKWVGFIHHTFDTTFGNNNNTELLKKQSFLDSLIFCKGLFVFSNHLKSQLSKELLLIGYDIPIHVFIHPTEIDVALFSWEKFVNNPYKKIIHVGGWLRNIFSFYNLSIPKEYTFYNTSHYITYGVTKCKILKCALKGLYMDNYYPIENGNSSKNINNSCPNSIDKHCSHNLDTSSTNMWEIHCHEYKKQIYDDVEIIDRVSNDDYDKLLSENIIFINLVDAAAVNTVIECIVRNTPIIINRHPSVVEILGEKYPLYFGDITGKSSDNYIMNIQVNKLLSDTNNIKSAYKYLVSMDKSKFKIERFIVDLKHQILQIR